MTAVFLSLLGGAALLYALFNLEIGRIYSFAERKTVNGKSIFFHI